MKRLYLLTFAIALSAIASLAGMINHSLQFDRDSLSLIETEIDGEKYILPVLGNLQNNGEVGTPSLPCEYISFALPVYADNIKLKGVSLSSTVKINLPNPLQPQQPQLVSSSSGDIYLSEVFSVIESENVSIYHIENYKGLAKIVTLEVCPVSFSNTLKEISLSQSVSFSIEYDDGACSPNTITSNINNHTIENYPSGYDDDMEFIKNIVVNPEDLNNTSVHSINSANISQPIFSSTVPAYEYTIVTSRDLAPSFERFVALKKLQGFNAGVVCIEDILANSFKFNNYKITESDSAAILRSYFLYNKKTIDYILLGGKPPIVPIRYGYFNTSEIWERDVPTDLYFGSPEDVDWNKSNDGLFGKYYYGFSYSSLFNIGRLLCSTPEDVINFTDKVEIYEQNPGLGDYSYLNNAYTHASTEACGWRESFNGIHYGEILNNALEKIFGFHYVSEKSNEAHTGTFVLNEMKDSHYAFYDIYGHGNPEGISTIDRGRFNPTNGISALDKEFKYLRNDMNNGMDNLDNFGYPAIFFSTSCATAPFDSPRLNGYGRYDPEYDILSQNIAESFTMGKNYGGPAYIGSSRTLYVGDGYMMTKIFFDELYSPSLSGTSKNNKIQKSLGSAKSRTLILSAAKGYKNHINLLGLSIIGDPSLCIWNGVDSIDNVEVESIQRESDGITIKLKDADSYLGTVVVFDQLNGPVVKKFFSEKSITVSDIDRNSAIYIHRNNSISYVDDLSITESTSIGGKKYFYAKKVTLGSHRSNDFVTLKANSQTTIDAGGDVYLNKILMDSLSNLIVKTAGKCYINNIMGQPGDVKISVYADTVIINEYPQNVNLSFSKYDKYRRPSEMKDVVIIDNTRRKAPERQDYIPLLEDGKEWHYTSVLWNGLALPEWSPELPREINQTLRLEGTTTIDGEEFHLLNAYSDIEDADWCHNPIAYLKEDTETRKVRIRINEECGIGQVEVLADLIWESGNDLVYDFNYNENTYIVDYGKAYGEETWLECTDGMHSGVRLVTGDGGATPYSIIEGLGLVRTVEGGLYNGSCYILFYGDSFMPAYPCRYYWPYLYEVVAGSGEVIYFDNDFAPGFAGVISEKAGSDTAVRVFNLQGIQVKVCDGTGCPTDGLAPGVYLIQTGATTRKILVGNR